MKIKLLCGLVALAFAGPALATAPLEDITTPTYYSVPGAPPPVYDVTNFQNDSVFSVTYSVFTPYPELYETMNTLYYTNNGTMIANSPISTNGFYTSFGCGYRFDRQTTNVISHGAAGTFYNPGTIRCNSTNDGNNVFNFGNGLSFFFLESFGECLVSATNIQNSGEIIVGPEGLIQLNGSNVDLSYGTLSLEQPQTVASLLGNTFNLGQTLPGLSAFGAAGTDTNADWAPGLFLTPTTATTSEPFQYQFSLTNSQPYIKMDQLDATDFVVRAVLIEDTSVDVSYQVYFGQNGLGGTATVQWTGAYLDPASGQIQNSYLYLNDDYLLGASTNVVIINGVPDNFTLTESTSQLPLTGLASSGFPPGFTFTPFSGITNPYAYLNGQFLSSSVATNSSGFNPSGALTNIAGRIFITASGDLNLANAQISGQNYMSLSAPYQFDGSPGALIESPFSDINVGVTNGFLTVSNLIAAGVPTFSGNLQAWSTRWTNTDINGINYDYRVMVVGSSFEPVSQSWIQNLTMHGTNSLVISDVMNVYKSLNIDAQNVTLTTNVYGNGATSPDGELNWDNIATLGPTQMPNVLWLTNNGAIRAGGISIFGSAAAKYGAFITTGLIEDQGTTIWATNFVNDGVVSNGIGTFALQAQTVTMTNGANGSVTAGSDLTIAAGSLVLSNEVLSAGRMLQLSVTNVLTDLGATNGSFWSVGAAGISGIDNGFNLPVKPPVGDLLGTTVTNIAPAGKVINNLWAALDRGYSNTGYNNNVAVGQLVLDVAGPSARLNFNGTGTNGTTNAIYVDCLQLLGYASYYPSNRVGTTLTALNFSTNLVIYYAQALNQGGASVAEAINHFNGDHLRWMPTYAGNFSGTNLVYPDGSVNFVNAALAASGDIDSNGNGSPNDQDSAPIFEPSEMNFTITTTNLPPKAAKLEWVTVANGTNYVYYKTNLLSPTWLPLNSFKNYYYDLGSGVMSGTNAAHTNWFASPFPYPFNPTNVWIYDTVTNMPHFYQIVVQPWLTGN